MKVFEEQVHIVIDKLKDDTKSDEQGEDLDKANKNLQSLVNHYKQIIYDTVKFSNFFCFILFIIISTIIDLTFIAGRNA